jgi:hypothetical protein
VKCASLFFFLERYVISNTEISKRLKNVITRIFFNEVELIRFKSTDDR